MHITFPSLLLVVAAICFLLAASGFGFQRFDALAAGFACWVLTTLLSGGSSIAFFLRVAAFACFIVAILWRLRLNRNDATLQPNNYTTPVYFVPLGAWFWVLSLFQV